MSNEDVSRAPSIAALRRCKTSAWRASFGALGARAIAIDVPESFVRYILEDGVSCEESNEALGRRIAVDEFDERESEERFRDADGEEARERAFPSFEREIADAIEHLGGACAPKFEWSAPKDSVWVNAGKTMKCTNADEVILLLKASDAVAHDLTDAYGACRDYDDAKIEGESESDRAVRENPNVVLTLREWYDLNPSMEFRCFVRGGNFCAVSQRHVNDYFEFLCDDLVARSIEFAIDEFWHENIAHTDWHAEMQDYVFDVYVTPKNKRVKLIDFNVWGGTTLPLLFDWIELEELGARMSGDACAGHGDGDACSAHDGVEFRIVTGQEHIRPGLQLGVPYDLYDTSSGGAIAEFLKEQRRQQAQES